MGKKDFPLLRQWLDSEHIYRWFGEPEFWLLECEYEPNSFFMLEYEGDSFGFCRYTKQIPLEYNSFFPHILLQVFMKRNDALSYKDIRGEVDMEFFGSDAQHDFAYISSLPVYFVDYGIGNQNYLGKGFGKKMLKLLCDTITKGNDCILVAASSRKNISSCNILRGNGFSYDEQSNLFLKIVMG